MWAFWPPDTPAETMAAHTGEGRGIWIPHQVEELQDFDADSDDETRRPEAEEDSEEDGTLSSEEVEDVESDEEHDTKVTSTWSKFSALVVDTGGDDEDEDEDDEAEDDERDSDH